MARAHRELITIEFKHNTDHYSEYQITEHEAESLFFALQEVLDIEWGSGPDCPGCGVREGDRHKSNCPKHIVENYGRVGDVRECPDTGKTQIYGEDGWRTVYNDKPVLKSEWETLVDALKSIANSSCCGDCQEAKRVAEAALYKVREARSIPDRGTTAPDWEAYYSNLYMAVAQRFQQSYGLKMSAADWDSLRRNFPRPTKV